MSINNFKTKNKFLHSLTSFRSKKDLEAGHLRFRSKMDSLQLYVSFIIYLFVYIFVIHLKLLDSSCAFPWLQTTHFGGSPENAYGQFFFPQGPLDSCETGLRRKNGGKETNVDLPLRCPRMAPSKKQSCKELNSDVCNWRDFLTAISLWTRCLRRQSLLML